MWHGARWQEGPHGDSAPGFLPHATTPSPPAPPENAPEAAAALLCLHTGCLPPTPALWCLPGLPSPAQPRCSPGPSPSPSLGPTAALLKCDGCHNARLRAGCWPSACLPALCACLGAAGASRACRATRRRRRRRRVRTTDSHARTTPPLLLLLLPLLPERSCSWCGTARQSGAL